MEKIAAGLDAPLTTDERALLNRAGGRSFPAFLEYSRGLDEMDRRRWREAEDAFTKALRIDPGFEQAAQKRKELQLKKGAKRP